MQRKYKEVFTLDSDREKDPPSPKRQRSPDSVTQGEDSLQDGKRNSTSTCIFTTSVTLKGGEKAQVPVRSTAPLPLHLFATLRRHLSKEILSAPLERGEIIWENALNTGVDLATATSAYKKSPHLNPSFLSLLQTAGKDRYQVALCAHRGDLLTAPENTLAAFRQALELEVDLIEFDVHLTRDGEIIAIHDSSIDRTTDGKGKIRHLDLAEIQSLSAGRWFGEEFQEEKVPTLDQVLSLMEGRSIPLIEIKSPSNNNRRIEEPLLEILSERKMEDRVIISTRDYKFALHLKEKCPSLWVLYLALTKKQMKMVWDTPLDGASPYWRSVSAEIVKSFHDRGKILIPWTVDDRRNMRDLVKMGVDGIISNQLLDLMEVLLEMAKRRGVNPLLWNRVYL